METKINETIPSIVLIDDDKLIHMSWKMFCAKRNLEFVGFMSMKEFMLESSNLNKVSRIYIDSHLGNGVRGELEAERIYMLGFVNLFLTTGYQKELIQKPDCIKAIYSKSPECILNCAI